jgi:hypothetical protein
MKVNVLVVDLDLAAAPCPMGRQLARRVVSFVFGQGRHQRRDRADAAPDLRLYAVTPDRSGVAGPVTGFTNLLWEAQEGVPL